MRIEINSQKGGVATISGFQADYTALLNETDSVIGALNRMKSYSYSMNGGLGVLQNAVGDIDSRIQAEESKRTALQTAQQKCNSFFTLVSQTDNSCAGMVLQNQEEFYQVNQWAAPPIIVSILEPWLEKAGKWINDSAKAIGGHISHSIDVYTETDFKELSVEELQEYYERLVALMEQGDISQDDRIRIMSFMEYLSKTTIDNDMSRRAKARVEMYNNLYERLHPDEAVAINTFFDNAPKDGIKPEDINNIKFIAYNSEQPAHDAFFENISDCRVNSWNHSGTAYYGQGEGETASGIHVNIEECANANNRYRTVFHELGHHIDDLLLAWDGEVPNAEGKVPRLSMTDFLSIKDFGDDGLRSKLYSDLKSTFKAAVIAVNSNMGIAKLNDGSVDRVVDALLDGRKKYSLNPYERTAYEIIQDGIESTDTFRDGAVSDVTGGLTNNTTAGYYRDGYHLIKSGIGHARYSKDTGQYYWYDGNDATGLQEKEFMAHYMEYAMTGDQEGMSHLKRVYPSGVTIIENMIKNGRIHVTGSEFSDDNMEQAKKILKQ